MTVDDAFALIDGTWPAPEFRPCGPWRLRRGEGGGQRVSAATAQSAVTEADIAPAEAAMRQMGQSPLFAIRAGDAALDALLDAKGYALLDPVTGFACPTEQLTDLALPRVSVFEIWEPLAIMKEIWAEEGTGPARLGIMERAPGPKTALLGRIEDQPAAAAFVALHQNTAMVHAVAVRPQHQRKGMGAWLMRAAAHWAARQGAHTLCTLCLAENRAATGLYQSLGMAASPAYHYRGFC